MPHSFISENICFEFSVQCLCSVRLKSLQVDIVASTTPTDLTDETFFHSAISYALHPAGERIRHLFLFEEQMFYP
jgi:hypothetical protein